MGRALLVALAACGFQSSAAGGADDAGIDAADAAIDGRPATCWKLEYANFEKLSACAPVGPAITVASDTSIDTDSGASSPAGLTCMAITVGPSRVVCAVVATSITIPIGKKLTAHGSRPLALLAHAIAIYGTVDVASHRAPMQRGPGGGSPGCSAGRAASAGGGGAGGTRATPGGDGGDQGGVANSGGLTPSSISDTLFRGGCDGGGGSDPVGGLDPLGAGLGGGAIWIASDPSPLIIGDGGTAAVINASGGGGKGGAALKRGGSGGGSGGMIVLQAATITLDGSAWVFANGGHGGGGGQDDVIGTDGTDPTAPNNGGTQVAGGPPEGVGGEGFPAKVGMRDGRNGKNPDGGGGGGGGGGGVIRVATSSDVVIDGANFSPKGARLSP
jgi:hypothetical protein